MPGKKVPKFGTEDLIKLGISSKEEAVLALGNIIGNVLAAHANRNYYEVGVETDEGIRYRLKCHTHPRVKLQQYKISLFK
ncbi:MAG TPA: hypothetical protein VJC17_01755 [Candidatus Dojkabacteria bacterium]|nr:hypothetical protein [Candidatus Dojkabacteria bacterium]